MTKAFLQSTTAKLTAATAVTIMAAAPALGAPIRLLTIEMAGVETRAQDAGGLFSEPIVLATYHDGEGGGGHDDGNLAEKPGRELNEGQTDRLVKRLEATGLLCGNIPREYRIDCLSDQYIILARSLPQTGEYREIREALKTAAEAFAIIAVEGRDPTAKKIRPRLPDSAPVRAAAKRPYSAIQPAKLASAERQAVAVLDELETKLLRSGENSGKRQVYYASIAQAVDSNKVLLRSA